MKGKKFTKNLLGLFFPNRCIFCRQIVASDQHICESCKENHLPQEITREIVWPECPTPILCQSVYAYCGEVKRSILDFKFHGKRENAGFYADVLKVEAVSILEEYEHDDEDELTQRVRRELDE